MKWLFDHNDWTDIALALIGGVLTFISMRWLVRHVTWIRDGLSKKEFAALFFLGLLTYMYWIDGNRAHEWSHFSDLQYITSYVFISVGLGLQEILEAIYAIKGVDRNGLRQAQPDKNGNEEQH